MKAGDINDDLGEGGAEELREMFGTSWSPSIVPAEESEPEDALGQSEYLQCTELTELRPYQVDVIEQCRKKCAEGESGICVVAPTGSGKTVIAAAITQAATAKGQHVLVLGHTREIINQTSRKLHAFGIDHGIIMSTDTARPYEAVQVASVQTYWSRVTRSKRMEPPPADLVIVDECHHIRARTWQKIIESYPGVNLIGLTADRMAVAWGPPLTCWCNVRKFPS
jgi:superfamily II DNA or RNA helicase